jgi:hypothetical protein
VPHSRNAFFCLGILAILAACESLGPPGPLPANARHLVIPAEFANWWRATESCSGLAGRLEEVSWYVVPGADTLSTPEGPKAAVWSHSSAGVRIVLAGDYADHELVVRHEMLHALLDREGHPPEYFRERCHLTWDTWGR